MFNDVLTGQAPARGRGESRPTGTRRRRPLSMARPSQPGAAGELPRTRRALRRECPFAAAPPGARDTDRRSEITRNDDSFICKYQ